MQVGNHCEDFPAQCGWSVGYGSNADESGDVSSPAASVGLPIPLKTQLVHTCRDCVVLPAWSAEPISRCHAARVTSNSCCARA